jgi:uncharacterized protein (TIGR03066 family)
MMRATLGCTLLALAVCVSASAEDKKDAVDAKKLVGKWEPKDKKDKAFTIEFTKDGKAIFGTDSKKQPQAEGTYKLDGNKLTLTFKFGDKEEKMVRTISKLTDTELTSKDDTGKEDTLIRIKDK